MSLPPIPLGLCCLVLAKVPAKAEETYPFSAEPSPIFFSCCPSFSMQAWSRCYGDAHVMCLTSSCYFWKLRKIVLLFHELSLTWGLGEERRKGIPYKVSYEPGAVTFPRPCHCVDRQGWTARSSGAVHCQQSLALCAIWDQVPLSMVLYEYCGWWAGRDVAGKQGGSSQPPCSWSLSPRPIASRGSSNQQQLPLCSLQDPLSTSNHSN